MTNEQTDGVQEIREMVRDFARAEIAPHVREWDEKAHFPARNFPAARRSGADGHPDPRGLRGAGLTYRHYVAVLEELGAVEGGIALSGSGP